jgi:hypothetical protein
MFHSLHLVLLLRLLLLLLLVAASASGGITGCGSLKFLAIGHWYFAGVESLFNPWYIRQHTSNNQGQ